MNGFNSKVVCKNSSVTIWEILFNIAIPIIHHKYRGGLVITRGAFVKRPLSLWYAPRDVPGGVNENFSPAIHRPYAGVCFPGGVCSGGVSAPGGCVCSWGVVCLLPGGSGPRGGLLRRGLVPRGSAPGGWYPSMHWGRTPPMNRMTDRCKNITLATTSLRPVITFLLAIILWGGSRISQKMYENEEIWTRRAYKIWLCRSAFDIWPCLGTSVMLRWVVIKVIVKDRWWMFSVN